MDEASAGFGPVVTAREPEQPPRAADDPAGGAYPGVGALDRALRALVRIETAATVRDTDLVPDAAATRRAFTLASVRSALTWRSQILRHALRTAAGVLLTFLVAWATVGPRDPLVTSMATASFAILQISWTQSLFKAKQRLLGVTGGATVMALALWLLPPSLLLPLSLLAALSGLWLIASNQVLSIGSFVVVSVGMNVVSREATLREALALDLGDRFTFEAGRSRQMTADVADRTGRRLGSRI